MDITHISLGSPSLSLSITCFNSEFSFTKICFQTKGIIMWNTNSLIQDLNSGRWMYCPPPNCAHIPFYFCKHSTSIGKCQLGHFFSLGWIKWFASIFVSDAIFLLDYSTTITRQNCRLLVECIGIKSYIFQLIGDVQILKHTYKILINQ